MKAHAENRTFCIRLRFVGLSLFCTTFAILLCSTPLNAQAKWNGTIDTAWNNSSNWSNGVTPKDTSSIVISVGSPTKYDAYVPPPNGSDTACTGDLTINSVGRLRFVNSPPAFGILKINGTLLLLQNSVIDLAGGKIIFKDSVSLQGNGIFQADSGVMTFDGTFWKINDNASFVPGTSTMILEGTGNQTISGDISFYNLVINTQGTVTLAGAVRVEKNLTIASGATVVVPNGDSLVVEAGCTVTNNGTVTGSGTIALPVEMVSIWALQSSNSVELKWTTATEVNNFGFDVERRCEGAVAWTKIGFVAGAGTSNALSNYSFRDNSTVAGATEYRVKQIDRDGSFKYSMIVWVEVAGAPRVLSLGSNYPNPFNPSTTIEFTVPQDGKATLRVYNILGQEVAALFDGIATAGSFHKVVFDASQLSSGVYFSRLESNGKAQVRRMVLMK